MPAAVVAAPLQHIYKAFEIGIDISMRMLERIAHTGLGREMDDEGKAILFKERLHCRAISQIQPHESEIELALQDIEAGLF